MSFIYIVAVEVNVSTTCTAVHLTWNAAPHYMIAFTITKSQPTLHVWTQTTACANEYQLPWHLSCTSRIHEHG